MTLEEAIDLILPAVTPASGTWADIGAGSGLFTEALLQILSDGKVIALDKSPHMLYRLHSISKVELEIVEGDFTKPLALPSLDGILMANALHYAPDHLTVLQNVLTSLKSGGTFVLIEYDTDTPNPPWVPNPISFNRYIQICSDVGLETPMVTGRHKSIYSVEYIYVTRTRKPFYNDSIPTLFPVLP